MRLVGPTAMPARTFHHRAMHFVSPLWPDVQHTLRYTMVKCSQRFSAFRTGCGRIVVRFGFGKIPVPHFKPSAATAKAYSCAMDSPKPSAHRGAARKTPVAMAKLEQTCPTSEEMRSSPYNIHNDAKHKLFVLCISYIVLSFRSRCPKVNSRWRPVKDRSVEAGLSTRTGDFGYLFAKAEMVR